MHEQPLDAVVTPVDHRLPPHLVRDGDDLTAETLDRVELRARRIVRRNNGRAHSSLTRRPGDALCHVSGTRGDDSVCELG